HVKPGEVPAPAPAQSDAAQPSAAGAIPAKTEPLRALGPSRPRRVMALGAGDPADLGGESAAQFLARTPLLSGVDPELVERIAAKSAIRGLAGGPGGTRAGANQSRGLT